VQELAGCAREEARAALEEEGWVVKNAWQALKPSRARAAKRM
jgi:hypothetical protein